ncbi:MAG: DUF5320 domain-containing protein [Candidatus Bathyarchaeia archaeon]
MPRGDRTGPWGAGPMSGRGAGYCAGYPVPGYVNSVRGYGRGFGRGWRRGYGRGGYVYPPVAVSPVSQQVFVPVSQSQFPEQEVVALESYHKDLVAEKAGLEQEMDGVKARIEELKAKQTNK